MKLFIFQVIELQKCEVIRVVYQLFIDCLDMSWFPLFFGSLFPIRNGVIIIIIITTVPAVRANI